MRRERATKREDAEVDPGALTALFAPRLHLESMEPAGPTAEAEAKVTGICSLV